MPIHGSIPSEYFTVAVILYNIGDITFAYKTIPVKPSKIISRTSYEYHKIRFDLNDIKDNMQIQLRALSTLEYTDGALECRCKSTMPLCFK